MSNWPPPPPQRRPRDGSDAAHPRPPARDDIRPRFDGGNPSPYPSRPAAPSQPPWQPRDAGANSPDLRPQRDTGIPRDWRDRNWRGLADVDTVEHATVAAPPATDETLAELAPRRGAAQRMEDRSLAERETLPRASVARPVGPRRGGARRWLGRAALVLALALLAARAGFASLALMSPGGTLLGWSITPPTVCVLCGVTTGPISRGKTVTPAQYAALLTSKLSLDDEIGQMLVAQWVGPGVTPDALQMINQQNVGGVLLKASNGNVTSVGQIQALTAQVQADSGNGIPLIVSTDQEGGCCGLNRLEAIAGPLPGAQDLTDPTSAYNDGAHTADLLHQYGFNLNLAPVVDVCQSNQSFCFRTFGSDPAQVAARAGAYVEGLQNTGEVTACLKHFPGLGAASGNPDLVLPYVYSSKAQWEATDLAPYRALLASEDIRAIMVTHVMIPAVDQTLPASLSPAFITDVLRNELGFTGAIITDDLWDISQYGQYTVPQAAVLSVKAGTDILIGAYAPGEKSGGATVGEMRDALEQAVQSGQITRQRIDDAVTHVLTLKIQMGLIQMPYHGPYPPRDIPAMTGSVLDGAPLAWVRPRAA